jgi:hypothetical protein
MYHVFEAHGVQRRAGYDPFKPDQLICIHSGTLNAVLIGASVRRPATGDRNTAS